MHKTGNDKVSVVITTYNGSKYVEEQLDSIRDQSRSADEVLILDDKSFDRTQELIKSYISKNGLSTWRLIENETNVGWRENFKNGFDLCTGDYILPCDQDDIWHLDKIERMLDAFKRNASIDLLTTNYRLFTSEDAQVEIYYRNGGNRMSDDGSVVAVPFDAQWCYIKRPGCSYCFTREFYEKIKEQWNTRFAHDAQLYRMAHLRGGLYQLNSVLFDYRRHGDNTTSNADKGKEMRIINLDYYLSVHYEALKWLKERKDSESRIRVVNDNIKFFQMRKMCIENRNLIKWPILAIRYHKNYRSWKGCLLDLVCALS